MTALHRIRSNSARGFTLLDLLITTAIVGLLAAIAYPSYSSHIVKARRAEAQLAMLVLMQQQENFYTAHNTYVPFSADATEPEARRFRWYSGSTPQASAYEISGHTCGNAPLQRCIELRATPGTARVNAGFRDDDCQILVLDSIGQHRATGPRQGCWP